MAVSTRELEDALAEAGLSPEAAPNLADVLQRMADNAIARQHAAPITDPSVVERLARIEQSLLDLNEMLGVRFDVVDHRFEQMERQFGLVDRKLDEVNRRLDVVERRLDVVDRRFEEVDGRFRALDERLNRERLERLGFVTAAAGAITAGLLRIFGAI